MDKPNTNPEPITLDDAALGLDTEQDGEILAIFAPHRLDTRQDDADREAWEDLRDDDPVTDAEWDAIQDAVMEDERDDDGDDYCPSCDGPLSPFAVECRCGFARFPEDGWVLTKDGYERQCCQSCARWLSCGECLTCKKEEK